MKPEKLGWILVWAGIFIYLFILQIHAVWLFTIDDMFISLRYASHLAQGKGLVWNIGEPPVEGYTNFTFVVLGALSIIMNVNPVFLLKSMGILGLLVTSIGVYGLARFWLSPALALIAPVWLLLYRGEIIWGISGLETSFFQAILILGLISLFKGMGVQFYPLTRKKPSITWFVTSSLAFSLAALTRPEAPIFILCCFFLAYINYTQQAYSDSELDCFALARKDKFQTNGWCHCERSEAIQYNDIFKQGLFWFAFIFILIFGAYFIARYCYFGRLFPNSVYCKGLAPKPNFILIAQYWKFIWPFMLASLPAIIWAENRTHYFLWFPGILYSLLLFRSDPIVAFDNRLFLPAYALIIPLALAGIKGWLSFWNSKKEEWDTIIFYGVAFLFSFFFIPVYSIGQYQQFAFFPQVGEKLRFKVGDWLTENIATDSKIVLGDSGLIPYYTQHKYIDSYCLNNAEMTQTVSADLYSSFCKNIFQKKPEVFILTALVKEGNMIYAPADACLAVTLKQRADYCPPIIFKTSDQASHYRYEIFIKKNPKYSKICPRSPVECKLGMCPPAGKNI